MQLHAGIALVVLKVATTFLGAAAFNGGVPDELHLVAGKSVWEPAQTIEDAPSDAEPGHDVTPRFEAREDPFSLLQQQQQQLQLQPQQQQQLPQQMLQTSWRFVKPKHRRRQPSARRLIQVLTLHRDLPFGGFDIDSRGAETEDDTDTDDFEGPHVVGSIIVLSVVGTLLFVLGNYVAPKLSEWAFTMSVILIYVATSVAIDLFISSQKEENDNGDATYAFDPICVVMTTEVIKLVISVALYLATRSVGQDAPQPLIPPHFSMLDVRWLAFPAVLFGTNNILIYYVILKNDISTFGIFRDTTILWTAVMWKGWFAVPLGMPRVYGILLIFLGLATSEVSELLAGAVFTWTFLWVCLLTLVNSFAGVSNEYAFKRNMQLDLNLQNIVLYVMGIIFGLATLLVTNPGALKPGHFFDGFTTYTFATSLLQAFGGLIVSRVLKYADAVTKTVAACLRGPTLILLAPLVINANIGMGVVISSFVIAFGCWLYLREGPMKLEDKDINKESEVANTDPKPSNNNAR